MSAVAQLARLLAHTQARAEPEPLASTGAIDALDALIVRLASQVRAGSEVRESVDLQRDMVQRFWNTRRLETLREARLVAFGLGLPAGPDGASLLDDKLRLEAVLQGLDGWLGNPRWFRRCLQGLVWSYFNALGAEEGEPGSNPNWLRLREYLQRRAGAAHDAENDPDWVKTLTAHPSLFSASPWTDFVAPLLRGERTGLDALCLQLGIGASSWFLRDLVRAQVIEATRASHAEFIGLLPAMLELLAGGAAWRDEGLALLLERYARIPNAAEHAGLRDAVVRAWGSPWRPMDPMRWGSIGEAARGLVGNWQAVHLIERFFLRQGQAGARRAAFWKRYAPSLQAVELALSPGAEPEEARGLVTPFADGPAGAAALMLTIGCARVVAFADPDEGVWVHDLRRGTPFDLSTPVSFGLDQRNSLRLSSRALLLMHQDGVNGWRQWEQSFEAALKDHFGLRVGQPVAVSKADFIDLSDGLPALLPGGSDAAPAPAWHATSAGEDVHWQTAEAMSVPYSRPDLEVLARVHTLTLKEGGEGRGRVRVDPRGVDRRIARVLERWGFVEDEDGDWKR